MKKVALLLLFFGYSISLIFAKPHIGISKIQEDSSKVRTNTNNLLTSKYQDETTYELYSNHYVQGGYIHLSDDLMNKPFAFNLGYAISLIHENPKKPMGGTFQADFVFMHYDWNATFVPTKPSEAMIRLGALLDAYLLKQAEFKLKISAGLHGYLKKRSNTLTGRSYIVVPVQLAIEVDDKTLIYAQYASRPNERSPNNLLNVGLAVKIK